MKQHITSDQWKEISEKQRDIMIDEWIFNHPLEVFSLPTIGQMIEFLQDNATGVFSVETLPVQSPNDIELGLWLVTYYDKNYRKPELCDALWEAVKEEING